MGNNGFFSDMTKSELQTLLNMGTKFVNRTSNKFTSIKFFYRNKPIEYFDDILWKNDGIMKKYMKDNNGDRYYPFILRKYNKTMYMKKN
jgi:hypothetical protein